MEKLGAIAEACDMEIDTLEVMEDHIDVFLSSPPRYSPACVMHKQKKFR